jgi:hypothetical protein
MKSMAAELNMYQAQVIFIFNLIKVIEIYLKNIF